MFCLMIMSVATALLQVGNDSADSAIYTHMVVEVFASSNSDFLLSVQKLFFVVPCMCMEIKGWKTSAF